MRTTIRLDEQLLAEAKQFATRTGRTLTAVIEDALRQALVDAKRSRKSASGRIPTFRGNGLQPGVDLDDTAALLDLMDEPR
jgi:Arc/MetJ family transcription regulator